jgi:hypothetical protein
VDNQPAVSTSGLGSGLNPAQKRLSAQLTGLIVAASASYASTKPAPLDEVWPILEAEARTIADPAVRCIEMLPAPITEFYDKYAAPIALVTATLIVVQPRVKYEIEYWKEARGNASVATPGGQRPVNGPVNGPQPGQRTGSNGANVSVGVTDPGIPIYRS